MNKDWGRLARSWQRGPLRSGNGLRIIAHRGFRATYPENTKSAFFADYLCLYTGLFCTRQSAGLIIACNQKSDLKIGRAHV